MDWNTLPDLLALIVLTGVFASLLRRRRDDGMRFWLVAWVAIVVHFGARFCDAAGTNLVLEALAVLTLQIAGLFFLWGIVSSYAKSAGLPLFLAYGVPQIAVGMLSSWNVSSRVPYIVALAFATVAPMAVGSFVVSRASDRRLIALSSATFAVPLAAVIAFSSDMGNTQIVALAWLYIWAGVLYFRRSERKTFGVLTTVFGFVAWGLVFPLSTAHDLWWANVHIDANDWNIPKYVVAIGIILTLLEEQIERSTFLALHDELTGLPNRRNFEERLELVLARARRSGSPLALLTIDLDRFKAINDELGHHAGDSFLRNVAQRFSRSLRPGDVCARYGGDEFIVIAEGLSGRLDAERIARDLIASLADPILCGGSAVVATASVGVALYPDDGADSDSLLAASDHAMYVSKRMRRVSYARG